REICGVSGEPICLGQKHEVLVPVQLPNELVVASPGHIEIWDSPEILQLGLYAARVIATPADLRARVDIPAENRERVFPDLRSQFDDFLGEPSAGQRLRDLSGHRQAKARLYLLNRC